jgi:ribonuclease G
MGFIVRTASEGAQEGELENDKDLLLNIWETIQRRNETTSAPSLIHSDLNMVLRATRDLITAEVKRVVTDSMEDYESISRFMETYMPRTRCEVELYEGATPIFDVYGIDTELDRALQRRVWLKSGGYIVIETTEALTAIDVNTGKFVGKRNLEETILKTNLEAVKEIAFQLRLRNIGGIIIIDFIDMEKESNRERVYQALELALRKDRARSNISKISELGLVEMTRKRTRESLNKLLGEPCPTCQRAGYVKSKTSVCYDIFREIERVSSDVGGDTIVVDANPEVAEILCEEERASIERLEGKLGKRIVVQGTEKFHQDEYEVVEV